MTYRIAFKRYKHSDNYLKDKLPDDLIIQFELYTNHRDPWESLQEEDFSNEFAKNTEVIQKFINTQVDLKTSIETSKLSSLKKQMANDKPEFQLYLQFLDWKDQIAKEQAELKAAEIKRLEAVQAGAKDTGAIQFTHPTLIRQEQLKNTRMKIR